ncbi:hypothetical protein ONV78_28975 [Hahella sp. CR1]|uniref:ClpX C4-type zinc finger protein n=1 Tax=Hahella sp. CR1 TaxID=2992807 RepID=UPI002442691D|nr:ClpX C4-type zinc finger protein [Hahella sp. CR1]MDG9671804.1 hypothetical protein [Hahella sp. CR1]
MIEYIRRKLIGLIARDMLSYCTFCGKKESEDLELVKGPCVTICKECVETAIDVLSVKNKKIYSSDMCLFCYCRKAEDNPLVGDGYYSICSGCVEQSALQFIESGHEFTDISKNEKT